jgi:hypothetical protein
MTNLRQDPPSVPDPDEDERAGLLETENVAPLADWMQDQVVEAFKGLSLSKDYSKQIHAHQITGRSLLVMRGEMSRFGGMQCIEKLGISCIGDQCAIIEFLQEQAVGEPEKGGRRHVPKQQRPMYEASKQVTTEKAPAKDADGWRRAKVKGDPLRLDANQLSTISTNPIFELQGDCEHEGESKTFSNPIFELGANGGSNGKKERLHSSYMPKEADVEVEGIGPFGDLFDSIYTRLYDLRHQIGLVVAILLLSFGYAFWNRLHTGGYSAVFLFLQLAPWFVSAPATAMLLWHLAYPDVHSPRSLRITLLQTTFIYTTITFLYLIAVGIEPPFKKLAESKAFGNAMFLLLNGGFWDIYFDCYLIFWGFREFAWRKQNFEYKGVFFMALFTKLYQRPAEFVMFNKRGEWAVTWAPSAVVVIDLDLYNY